MDATSQRPAPNATARPRRKWPARRWAGVVTGPLLVVGAVGLICVGVLAAIDSAGGTYIGVGARGSYRTDRYALATNSTNWRTQWLGWAGAVRLKVASAGPTPIFVGVAGPDAIGRYLSSTGYTTVAEHGGDGVART